MHELSALGFGPFFQRQLREVQGAEAHDLFPARIAAEHRGAYEVWCATGDVPARLAGRLRHELEDESLPGVGDWVLLKQPPKADEETLIDRVLARRTAFVRGIAGQQSRGQVIAANVDLVFVVCGLDADYNIRRIERYLARIRASGAEPAVILNKSDLCDDIASRIAEIERHCPGVPIYPTTALHSQGLTAFRENIREGLTAAFVGSSGAGKSTLANAMLGEVRMPTREVRARDGRGCHRTTHRQLLLLPGGGVLLDTPGMRELQLVDAEGLAAVFDDIAILSQQCRYRDCRHETEPGCAVRAAVESGELDEDRLEHYRKLEHEARANERRHDARQRRQAERMWGQLHNEVSRLRRWKGGK